MGGPRLTMDDAQSPLSEAQREKIKLRANYINGIALAFVVAAALTIPLSVAGNVLHPAIGIPFAGLCFFVSLRLHLLAQDVLEDLCR